MSERRNRHGTAIIRMEVARMRESAARAIWAGVDRYWLHLTELSAGDYRAAVESLTVGAGAIAVGIAVDRIGRVVEAAIGASTVPPDAPQCVFPGCVQAVANWYTGPEYVPIDTQLCEGHHALYAKTVATFNAATGGGVDLDEDEHVAAWTAWIVDEQAREYAPKETGR